MKKRKISVGGHSTYMHAALGLRTRRRIPKHCIGLHCSFPLVWGSVWSILMAGANIELIYKALCNRMVWSSHVVIPVTDSFKEPVRKCKGRHILL